MGNFDTGIKINWRGNWNNLALPNMEEIEKTEAENKEDFIKEYEALRKKYGYDYCIEVRLNIEKVNIPK